MKILITAIGITGKSSLRRILVQRLKKLNLNVVHYDADEYDVTNDIRHPLDKDCLKKLPEHFVDDTVYIIEDVHGPVPKEAVLPINEYDWIIYVLPGIFSYSMFWIPRLVAWFENGKFAWEKVVGEKGGWQGTGKPKDFRNIIPILKEFLCNLWNRRKWIKEDLSQIKGNSHFIVKSSWSKKGPRFSNLCWIVGEITRAV